MNDHAEGHPRAAADTPAIVAIGASAGGLAACTVFLQGLPVDTGMAFVVIQHLDPHHDSHLTELLGKATAMTVVAIEDGMPVAPDHVYVMPPNATLTIEGNVLRLQPRNTTRLPMPIDVFLRSLATERGAAAIAVILSGSGSDGSLGVQAIHELGGLCFAQEPAEAGFDGMPSSAIATGCVDSVLAAASLGPEIVRLARSLESGGGRHAVPGEPWSGERGIADTVIARLRVATGVDFSQYRQTTVQRRMRRRIALRGLPDLRAYLDHLDGNPGELQELAKDLLISVTRFFRDSEVFVFLAQVVFPDLIRRSGADGVVRIWVAGCSTGEEAYSLAITFLETAHRMQSHVTCQVFATDVNETVLEKARRAVYVENIATDVSAERLARFFTVAPDGFRIRREVRNLCVFSRHDLLSDPPLSRMDLVSCRNLLIYLSDSQRFVLERLHFALDRHGHLLLGPAESITTSPDLFEVVDKDAHVFRARDLVTRRASFRSPRDARRGTGPLPLDADGSGAAYEELVAANEELQSLNEELESSKEEIESINEELTTLNQELRSRNVALQIANEFSAATFDTIRSGLVVVGPDQLVVDANRSFHRMFHLTPERIERRRLADVVPECFADPLVQQWLTQAAGSGSGRETAEFTVDGPTDQQRVFSMSLRRVLPGDRLLVAIDDVTQLRQLEADRRQSQKMEAIGQLAAGVAHDFNNLLTIVLGGAQMVTRGLPPDSPLRQAIGDVEAAAQRAAGLTQQMLAYAGRGRHFVEFVDLSQVVVQAANLLHALVPTHVQCRLDLGRELPRLLADRSQIHQVVDNLMKNAFEAVGDREGTITVRTGREVVAHDAVEGLDPGTWLAAGDYLFVEVQDTGVGMTPDSRRRMFDPFFTTKFTGRGLGLAAVHGIVRQHSGTIKVTSVLDRGTSIRVLLAIVATGQPPSVAPAPPAPRRGTETIMVVDDEPMVLEIIQRALEIHGYRVLPASAGVKALALLRAEADIAAVVLDATMAGMSGLETLEAMRALRPDLPVVVCSGLGDSAVEAAFAGHGVVAFVHKPFKVHELGIAVARCLPPVG